MPTRQDRSPEQGPAESRAASPVRVVLVGGTADQAEKVRAALAASTTMSFRFSHAPRLASALELLRAREADALLVEVSRSEGDRPALLSEVRAIAPEIAVVALGDVDDEGVATRALQSGARAYLLKQEAATRVLVTTLGGALSSQRTVLELNAARERARDLATSDQLTGLSNRLLFKDRLFQALASARRNHKPIAVMLLDLDGFKIINDSLGHAVGDGFLRAIARRLTSCLREADTAARLGGDEFGVLITQLEREIDAASVARKILASVSVPTVLRNRSFVTTASIGIATFPRDGLELEDLVTKAETAMVHAKQQGRDRYEFFAEEMNAAIRRRTALESRLRTALSEHAFSLLYQPQFDTRQRRIMGAEALLRWNHPELGLLLPEEFLPAAEDAGLIVPIGEWVLRTACRHCSLWQEDHADLRVSVNVAPQQFHEPGFAGVVHDALEDCGLPPECLELEITESSLVQDLDVMVNTLRSLKRVGVRLAIDDFGTGYSSLAYLKKLPIDVLKIDRSFVRTLPTDRADATLTHTIVQMARGLGLDTVAEGVECAEQMLRLEAYGCERMQGALFGEPMSAERLPAWLGDLAPDWVKELEPLAS